jgi:hypothetical protein
MEGCQFSMTKKVPSKSRLKTMLLTFFDIRGIVHYEFVPTGQAVNHVYYLEVLIGCLKKLDGNNLNLCQKLLDLAS